MVFDYIIGCKESQKIGSSLKRPKYNYKKAGALFDRMFYIISDMPDFMDTYNRQKERRYFMRELTRDGDMSTYYDAISDYMRENATDHERVELKKIVFDMVTFNNEV